VEATPEVQKTHGAIQKSPFNFGAMAETRRFRKIAPIKSYRAILEVAAEPRAETPASA